MNTELRRNAKNDFGKDIFNLMKSHRKHGKKQRYQAYNTTTRRNTNKQKQLKIKEKNNLELQKL